MRPLLLALPAAVATWAAFDLSRPPAGDLREFDPAEVARLETAMWRSYYDGRPIALFGQLALLARSQYRAPMWRSYVTAYHAARAAFVFKDGRGRSDYEMALPGLEAFYRTILPPSRDAARVARLELEWWIAHREREGRPPGDLERGLSELQAAIYGGPAGRFEEHARRRAEAMLLRDARAASGSATAEDWRRIEELLREAWAAHWRAVRPQPGRRSGTAFPR